MCILLEYWQFTWSIYFKASLCFVCTWRVSTYSACKEFHQHVSKLQDQSYVGNIKWYTHSSSWGESVVGDEDVGGSDVGDDDDVGWDVGDEGDVG
jgi:hypothetical protein